MIVEKEDGWRRRRHREPTTWLRLLAVIMMAAVMALMAAGSWDSRFLTVKAAAAVVCDARTHYRTAGDTCEPLSTCAGLEVEAVAPTPTSDRVCNASATAADCYLTSKVLRNNGQSLIVYHADNLDGLDTRFSDPVFGSHITYDSSSGTWVGRIGSGIFLRIPALGALPSNAVVSSASTTATVFSAATSTFVADATTVFHCSSRCNPLEDPCCFHRMAGTPSRDVVRTCLDSLTIDGLAMRSTLRTIQSGMASFYGFAHLAANSTASAQSLHPAIRDCGFDVHPSAVDVPGWVSDRIMALDTAVDTMGNNNGSTTEAEYTSYRTPARLFHREVAEALAPLQDAHTSYLPPFWGVVSYSLRLRLLKNATTNEVTVLYTPQNETLFSGNETIATAINGLPPVDWIREQADETVYGYRSAGARFNQFINSVGEGRFQPRLSRRDLLDESLDSGINISFVNPTTMAEHSEIVTVQPLLASDVRRWFRSVLQAYYDGTFRTNSIKTDPVTAVPTRRRRQVSDQYEKGVPLTHTKHVLPRIAAANKRTSEAIPHALPHATEWLLSLRGPNNTAKELTMDSRTTQSTSGRPVDKGSVSSLQEIIDRFSNRGGDVVDVHESESDASARLRRSAPSIPSLPLAGYGYIYGSAFSDYAFCLHGELDGHAPAVILKITTFSPPGGYTVQRVNADLLNVIETCTRYAQDQGITKLLLDMSANGGGLIPLLYQATAAFIGEYSMRNLCDPSLYRISPLLQRFIHEYGRGTRRLLNQGTQHPFSTVEELRTHWISAMNAFREASTVLADGTITYDSLIDFVTERLAGISDLDEAYDLVFTVLKSRLFLTESVQDEYVAHASSVDGFLLSNGDAILRGLRERDWGNAPANYSRLDKSFGCPDAVELDMTRTRAVHDLLFSQFEDVALLVDGVCGSACSFFSTNLLFTPNITVFSFGGIPTGTATPVPLDISSFGGANVFSWESVWRVLAVAREVLDLIDTFTDENLTVAREDLVFAFPSPAAGRFGFHMFLNEHLGTEALPREWYTIPAHLQFDIWEPTADIVDNLVGFQRLYGAVLGIDDWDAVRAAPQFYGAHCTQPRSSDFVFTTTVPLTSATTTTLPSFLANFGQGTPFYETIGFIVGMAVLGACLFALIVYLAFLIREINSANNRVSSSPAVQQSKTADVTSSRL